MIVKFAPHTEASMLIRTRVQQYLDTQDETAIRTRMLLKTAVIFAWALASYLTFLFWATEAWQIALTAVSMGLASAGIGMGVMHDANHGAYPVGPRLRRAIGFSLDLLGGSSYIWRFQHNVNHHTFTNVLNADNDIAIGTLARLSPAQKHRWYHRGQHIYLWPLYSLLALSWAFWADWRDFATGSIGENKFRRPHGIERVMFWGGKLGALILWVVIPIGMKGVSAAAGFGLVAFLVLGFVLSTIFQLAHVVEGVAFPSFDRSPARSELEFFEHQFATTANFETDKSFINWYIGGLNYQVEHHLFPKVCHLHYPALAKIVRDTRTELGLPYRTYPTFRSALGSHSRWLREMGRPPGRPVRPRARIDLTRS